MEQQPDDGTSAKKRTRGPTQKRGVWAQRDGPLQVSCNEYGQPDDEMASAFSNFIGVLMRDGKNAPLGCLSWNKVDKEDKERLWNLLKEYYDIPDASKTWTMQKFGKQLKNWRSRVKKTSYRKGWSLREMKKIKDSRVSDETFETLVEYWSTERAQDISNKNKLARSRRTHNHTTGTKSFARVYKEKKNELQRKPRRSELFKTCYTKKDGTQAGPVKDAIEKMSKKENENSSLSSKIISNDDSFAQVMGRDKNGKFRMLGAGVCPTLVFNDVSNRGANQMQLIKKLQEHNKSLLDQVNQLKSNVMQAPNAMRAAICENDVMNSSENALSDPTQPRDDIGPILQVANRGDWVLRRDNFEFMTFSGNYDSISNDIQIGERICLRSILDPDETIATGKLYSKDPLKEVGSQELGSDHWEIYVEAVMKPKERLERSCGHYKTIGDAVGDYIPWPKPFIREEVRIEAVLVDDENDGLEKFG
ncbi:hypothetical protein OROMI_021105 [Orobanche minor]